MKRRKTEEGKSVKKKKKEKKKENPKSLQLSFLLHTCG